MGYGMALGIDKVGPYNGMTALEYLARIAPTSAVKSGSGTGVATVEKIAKVGGVAGGAILGSILGSAIPIPGVGTAIGTVIGVTVGALVDLIDSIFSDDPVDIRNKDEATWLYSLWPYAVQAVVDEGAALSAVIPAFDNVGTRDALGLNWQRAWARGAYGYTLALNPEHTSYLLALATLSRLRDDTTFFNKGVGAGKEPYYQAKAQTRLTIQQPIDIDKERVTTAQSIEGARKLMTPATRAVYDSAITALKLRHVVKTAAAPSPYNKAAITHAMTTATSRPGTGPLVTKPPLSTTAKVGIGAGAAALLYALFV